MNRGQIFVLLILVAATAGVAGFTLWSESEGSQALTPSADAPVMVGAGDIAQCSSDGKDLTAALLDEIPGTVFTLGDNAYFDGSEENFAECYDPSWGRHRERTRPAPGGHDYMTAGAAPYFAYFGEAAGTLGSGYYAYQLGDWHVVVLNTICDNVEGGCGPDSPQLEWLAGQLQDQSACMVAYMHHPWFSSGEHGPDERAEPFFRALYAAGVDVVLGANDHVYERFAPQDPEGNRDAVTGLRQFVVGTGGGRLYDFDEVLPNSEFRSNDDYGVLKLTLEPGRYFWEFITTDGTAIDSGSDECHGPPG